MGYRSAACRGIMMQDHADTVVRDRLARQRTQLANERTLLAYIRTALGLFAVGIPALWWLEQPGLRLLGWSALAGGVLLLGIGLRRFFAVRAEIHRE